MIGFASIDEIGAIRKQLDIQEEILKSGINPSHPKNYKIMRKLVKQKELKEVCIEELTEEDVCNSVIVLYLRKKFCGILSKHGPSRPMGFGSDFKWGFKEIEYLKWNSTSKTWKECLEKNLGTPVAIVIYDSLMEFFDDYYQNYYNRNV